MDDSNLGTLGATAEDVRLLGRINELERMLDEATSKIMRLEGTADQITDTEIAKKVESLRDAIQQWVNGVEQDLRSQGKDFKTYLQRVLRDDDGRKTLHKLGLLDDSGCGAEDEWMIWLGGLSTCIHVVLGRRIWVYIQREILRLPFPVGVPRVLEDTFNDIINAMTCDGGGEDKMLLIDKWRSDTIRALIKTSKFQEKRRDLEMELPENLAEALAAWIDRETIDRHFSSLKDKIVHPAIHIQEQISCSSHDYRILDPEPRDLRRGKIPDELVLSSWTLTDMVKWRPIHGEIGGVFAPLYHAIYRRGPPGEQDVLVLQPVVLMYDLATSKTAPGNTPRLQPQRDLEKAQDARHDSQRAAQRSSQPSPERRTQRPPPTDTLKHALGHTIHEEPAAMDYDHGRHPQRGSDPVSTSSQKRRVDSKRDERPSGDRSSDSTDDHRRRHQRTKTGDSSAPSVLGGLFSLTSKPAKSQEPKQQAQRPSKTRDLTPKHTAIPDMSGGPQRPRTDPPVHQAYEVVQAMREDHERELGPQRRDSGDRRGDIPGTEITPDGAQRWKHEIPPRV